MKSFPINTPFIIRALAPFGGVMLAGMILFGGDINAQQYPVADQTSGQVPGQVDLLATVQGDNSSSPSPSISSIDDAVRTITGESDAGSLSDDGASDAAESTTATDAAQATITVSSTADNATDADADAPAPAVTVSTTPRAAGASLERAAAPTFGVADIGVDPTPGEDTGLTATIWRGTKVEHATMLLDTEAIIGSSPTLSALAGDVVARRAVRPEGASETDSALMSGRLDWLAAAGRSEDLAVMVDQLPAEAPWLGWKQWLVETQLMSRRDDDACRNVMYQVGRTFEPFWHKAKVICTAVQKGDIAGAQFAADILFAMGVDDPVFAALVGKLLSDTDPGPLDPALVDQLHIVLMEAAHHDIGIAGLDALPDSSIQTAVGLRYLDADARLVATWRALSRGLIDHERAAKLWRSARTEADPLRLALARHQSQPSALTRALVWRALDAEKSADRLSFIAAALDVDIADGAGPMMAPLYAELAREALAFDGAADRLASDAGALKAKLGVLIGVGDAADLPDPLSGGEAGAARDLLDMAQTGRAEMTSMAVLGKFSLLPLVTSGDGRAAMEPGAAMSWLVSSGPGTIRAESFLSASPVVMQALDEAATAGRVAETVLLAHRVVGATSLAEIDPADVARIAAALEAVGQAEAARRFRHEVVAAHLLARAQTVRIDLPPVTAVAPATASDTATVAAMGADAEAGTVTPADPATSTGNGMTGAVIDQTGTMLDLNEQGTTPESGVRPTQQDNGISNL